MSATDVNSELEGKTGYVYVLGVADMDLPVCKIGRTSRDPATRCMEINQSSTGDFRWKVEHQIAVSDCKTLESKIHAKLLPMRQKGREFFNISPDMAIVAIQSILKLVPEIRTIDITEHSNKISKVTNETPRRKKQSARPNRDIIYAHLLGRFNELLLVQGRPFGQLNKPYFGISDGREGVQWNLSIFPKEDSARVGVNLEGLKYRAWPIATLIKSELEDPQLLQLVASLSEPQNIVLRFERDAWQRSARLSIVEEYFCGREFRACELTADLWHSILIEALGCLNEELGHLGRARQIVTLRKSTLDSASRLMEVSPHLTIWTSVDPLRDSIEDLASAIDRLQPIHRWASLASGGGSTARHLNGR